MDGDVYKGMWRGGGIDGLQQHGAAVLVKELWCGVDVVICSGIWAANHHHGQTGCPRRGWMVDAVVVNGWLEKV